MLGKRRWWGVALSAAVLTTLTFPFHAVAQTVVATVDANTAGTVFCPKAIIFAFNSTRTGTSRDYRGVATRGADAALGKVYYYFDTAPQVNGTYVAAGNFWLWGLECRMGSWTGSVLNFANKDRLSYVEVDNSGTSYASGGACSGREDQAGDDPYSDSESPINGGPTCSGGATGDGGDTGQPPPAPPDGTTCTKEYLVIEVSNDGGQTWETWWQGEGFVCS